MKRENIEQRIKNFFSDFDEPLKTECIDYAIKCFDIYREIMRKEISDSRVISYAIEKTCRRYRYQINENANKCGDIF